MYLCRRFPREAWGQRDPSGQGEGPGSLVAYNTRQAAEDLDEEAGGKTEANATSCSPSYIAPLKRDASGREGTQVRGSREKGGSVPGSGRAGERGGGWQVGAHLVISHSAGGGGKPASGPLSPPFQSWPYLYLPLQLSSPVRKIPRDQAPELSLRSRDNKILVHMGGAIFLPSLPREAGNTKVRDSSKYREV